MKEKLGCVFALLSIFVSLPLGWVYGYMLLTHVNAPREIWLLFFINIPVSLILSIGFRLAESFTKEEK